MNSPHPFPSTHWSEVERAGLTSEEAGQTALGDLLSRYRPALEAYACQRFHNAHAEVADWFQGFVAGPVLQRGLIANARRLDGHRFRSYLLSAWHTFILEQHRHDSARKRLPEGGFVPLTEVTSSSEVTQAAAPPAAETFDVAWARAVLAEAAARMKAECLVSGRPDLWGVFEERIHRPILEGCEPLSYDLLVKRFEIETPVQARNLLVTGKRLFTRCLRRVIAQYTRGEEAILAELHELKAILEKAP